MTDLSSNDVFARMSKLGRLVEPVMFECLLKGLHEDFKDLEFTAPVTKIETAVATQRELCKRAIKHAIDDLKPKEAPNEDE